jgi:hypothetical protein
MVGGRSTAAGRLLGILADSKRNGVETMEPIQHPHA